MFLTWLFAWLGLDYSELLEDEQENEGLFEGVTSISCPSMEQKDSKRDDVKRDIRKYYCEYCGICRSKKTLITAHVLLNHKVLFCIFL